MFKIYNTLAFSKIPSPVPISCIGVPLIIENESNPANIQFNDISITSTGFVFKKNTIAVVSITRILYPIILWGNDPEPTRQFAIWDNSITEPVLTGEISKNESLNNPGNYELVLDTAFKLQDSIEYTFGVYLLSGDGFIKTGEVVTDFTFPGVLLDVFTRLSAQTLFSRPLLKIGNSDLPYVIGPYFAYESTIGCK
jgi:hypothetical protein